MNVTQIRLNPMENVESTSKVEAIDMTNTALLVMNRVGSDNCYDYESLPPELASLIMDVTNEYGNATHDDKNHLYDLSFAMINACADNAVNSSESQPHEMVLVNTIQNNVVAADKFVSQAAASPRSLDGGSYASDSSSPYANDNIDQIMEKYKCYLPQLDWSLLDRMDVVARAGAILLILMNTTYAEIFNDLSGDIARNGLLNNQMQDVKDNLSPISSFFAANNAVAADGVDMFASFAYYMGENPNASDLEKSFANTMGSSFFADMKQKLQQYNQKNPNNQITPTMLANGDSIVYDEATSVSQVPQQTFMHFYVSSANNAAQQITQDKSANVFSPAWTTAGGDSFFNYEDGIFSFTFTAQNVQNKVGNPSGNFSMDGSALGNSGYYSAIALENKNTVQELVNLYSNIYSDITSVVGSSVIPNMNHSWLGS